MAKFLKALILIIIFLVGVALIVLPFVYHMPSRTSAADKVMTAFGPIVNQPYVDQLNGALAQLAQVLPPEAQRTAEMRGMVSLLQTHVQTIADQIPDYEKSQPLPIKWMSWLLVGLGAVIVVLLILRLMLWRPSRKSKDEAPAKPAVPNTPTPPAT
jgi:tellurite resistance protein TehA-like permease